MLTQEKLQPQTLDTLKALLQQNADSVKLYQEALTVVTDPVVKTLFSEIVAERETQAHALGRALREHGEATVPVGTLKGDLHRFWTNFKLAIRSNNLITILEEAERGEDFIKRAYEELLPQLAGSPMTSYMNNQYLQVKKRHDQVKAVRDQMRAHQRRELNQGK